MNELLLELRHTRAEAALQAAASGTRNWCMDMALAAPLSPTCDALPREPELLALLDPLVGSALATLNTSTPAREVKAEAPRSARQRMRFDPTAPGSAPSVMSPAPALRGARQAALPVPQQNSVWRNGPTAEAGLAQARAASPQAVTAPARPATSSPARIAEWLARHAHLAAQTEPSATAPALRGARQWASPVPPQNSMRRDRPAEAGVAPARTVAWLARHAHLAAQSGPMATSPELPSRAERQADAKVVPLPLRRGAVPADAVASRLLRWQQMLETPQACAALLGADTPTHAREPAPTATTAPAAQRSRTLGELAATARPTSAAPPTANPAETAPLPPQALAALNASLARIEQRQLNATPAPAPLAAPEPTQWFDADDDALAERIHAILRRQALRHGIGGP